jgi:hypothetical protein
VAHSRSSRKTSRRRRAAPAGTADRVVRPAAAATPPAASARHWLLAFTGLAALSLLIFGDALFSTEPVFLSNRYGDLASQFLDWRTFGFDQLRHGEFPLWNPHLFGGAPYFGGFQSALLYPPNVLFLIVPLDAAVNWSIALHVFLAGAFTYGWAIHRRLRPAAAFLGATVFMFCGAHFYHVYAGHLSNLCTLVWAPLLFLAIDGVLDDASLGWSLLGMFAAAMAVLAGHPQYVFYLAVAAGIYGVLGLARAPDRMRRVAGLVAIGFGAAGLSAVQLLTGLQESRELVRQALDYKFVAQFSLPPENILTLLVPHLFGMPAAYWGRGYLWEGCLFIGVTALALALVGAIWGDPRHRRFSVTMTGVLLLLALGAHTPLFGVLYRWVPGFDQFRGSAKFIGLASLFLSMLTATGLDIVITERRVSRSVIGGLIGTALVAVVVAFMINAGAPDGWWDSVMLAARDTGDTLLPGRAYTDPAFVRAAADTAWRGLALAAVFLGATAALLAVLPRYRVVPQLLLILAIVEVFVFARGTVEMSALDRPELAPIEHVLDTHPGEYRILNLINPNAAMSLDAEDVWGYDPSVVSRYAQLVALTQGANPDTVNQDLAFTHDSPLLDVLRCRFIFYDRDGRSMVTERPTYLPHVLLISHYRALATRHDVLSALANPSFDPRAEVILEAAPDPAPIPSSDPGTARIVDASTDHLTIEAVVKSPSILLVTDAYASGWHIDPLDGTSQRMYRLIPADYGLRGVPLAAGVHRFRMEYRPSGFVVGRLVSLIFVVTFFALVLQSVRQRKQRRASKVLAVNASK